jgi:dihydropteroate synthase
MRHVLAAGADMINDINGFRAPGAVDAVRASACGLCVMHMRGEPQTMQAGEPEYDDVVMDVQQFLAGRVAALQADGIAKARICVDPGFGFGKAVIADNYALLAHLPRVAPPAAKPYPVLAGLSRKSMLGAVTGRAAAQRLAASIAAAVCAAQRGAAIIRVHDVAQTVDALKVWQAVRDAG